MKKKILVLDSHSLIHRAYHALPPLKNEKGEIVNAVYGFFSILIRTVQDFSPTHVAAVFDFPAPTFRHQKFKDYKKKRPPTPKDLSFQIPKTKKALIDFGIQTFEKKGFEADDIIGTICRILFSQKDVEIIIASGDMDNLQLVNEKTKVFLLKRGIKEAVLCDSEKVEEIYGGLKPNQLIDYKGLKGDPSDNIPGVPGVGEKTALSLIENFKTLENLYQQIKKENLPKEVKKETVEKLLEFEKQAFLSKDLVLIKKDVPVDFNLEKCAWDGFQEKDAQSVFQEFGFHSLIKRIAVNGKSNNLSLF